MLKSIRTALTALAVLTLSVFLTACGSDPQSRLTSFLEALQKHSLNDMMEYVDTSTMTRDQVNLVMHQFEATIRQMRDNNRGIAPDSDLEMQTVASTSNTASVRVTYRLISGGTEVKTYSMRLVNDDWYVVPMGY